VVGSLVSLGSHGVTCGVRHCPMVNAHLLSLVRGPKNVDTGYDVIQGSRYDVKTMRFPLLATKPTESMLLSVYFFIGSKFFVKFSF
jgi:hypothetical protein